MAHFSWINFFWYKQLFLLSSNDWPFHCAKFKINLEQSYEDAQFLGLKWPTQNENFFRKPVNEPSLFHPYLSTCQKLKLDINLLVIYWRLKNTEISLAITWERDFSQACSFCRMLTNHKNSHFTQIPDKTNVVIFLKSPKTMFLGHFWPFLPNGDFFKKSDSVTYNYIWAPNTMLSFRKN